MHPLQNNDGSHGLPAFPMQSARSKNERQPAQGEQDTDETRLAWVDRYISGEGNEQA